MIRWFVLLLFPACTTETLVDPEFDNELVIMQPAEDAVIRGAPTITLKSEVVLPALGGQVFVDDVEIDEAVEYRAFPNCADCMFEVSWVGASITPGRHLVRIAFEQLEASFGEASIHLVFDR